MYMAITVVILMDMYNHLAPQDKEYFRASREALFGQKLEEVSFRFQLASHEHAVTVDAKHCS